MDQRAARVTAPGPLCAGTARFVREAGELASGRELSFRAGIGREFQEPAGGGRRVRAAHGRAWVAHHGAERGSYLGEWLGENRGACPG